MRFLGYAKDIGKDRNGCLIPPFFAKAGDIAFPDEDEGVVFLAVADRAGKTFFQRYPFPRHHVLQTEGAFHYLDVGDSFAYPEHEGDDTLLGKKATITDVLFSKTLQTVIYEIHVNKKTIYRKGINIDYELTNGYSLEYERIIGR